MSSVSDAWEQAFNGNGPLYADVHLKPVHVAAANLRAALEGKP